MTDKQQSEVRATAAALETLDMGGVADLVRRQYAELETMRAKLKTHEDLGDAGSDMQLLRTGYAAARLEIESLRACGAQPAGAQQPGVAYAVLTYKQVLGSKNCMQCCVSYMLGLPLESVPDFATDGGWELFSDFAESQGYAAVMLPGNREFEADYLASGTTARGTSHMVVMNDGKLVHDPHPSNAGLVEVQCVWLLAKKAGPQWHHDERAAFEASAKAFTSNVSFERDGTDYADMTASLLWHGWKLRAARAPADSVPALDRDRIREIFMAHGFTVKEGQTDLKQYVYDAADALLRAARAPAESVTAPGGGVVAAGRFMDEAAERRSAQEGYENRIKRVSERNPHDEGMYSLGWWDRAWKAAAPTTQTAPAAVAGPSDPSITLDFKQATELLKMFGGEPGLVTLQHGNERSHSGAGLYAWHSDLPEEGAAFLGAEPHDEAAPTTQPVPQQEVQGPVAWQSRTRPTWEGNTSPWTPWKPCTKEQAEDCWKTRLLNGWAYEARALYTAPPPSPAPLSDDLRDRLVAISEAIAYQDDRAAQAMLREILKAPQPSPAAQGDALDAARWHWIAEYLVGPRTDLDDEIVVSETVNDLRKLVDAARAAQEGKK